MRKIIITYIFILGTSVSYSQYPPPPTLGTGESYTKLFSVSYDYQTNGSTRYLVQDPTNPQGLCVILMAQHDSTTPSGTGRYVFSAYTSNLGTTWDTIAVATDRSYGFPCMDVRNGAPVVVMHASGIGTYAFQDVIFGGLSWGAISGFPNTPIQLIWPQVTVTTNSNVNVWGAPNVTGGFFGTYTTYNGTTWTPQMSCGNSGGPSGNFALASGSGGVASSFGINYSGTTGGNDHITWCKSTNNGINYSQDNSVPPYIIDGADTLYNYIECGRSAVYAGSDVHLVFGVYSSNSEALPSPDNTVWFKKTRIYHWNPTTGLHLIASSANIPTLTDTITQVLVTPICHPCVGRLQNGTLICSYTTYLRGNTQIVDDGSRVNCGEIFYSLSTNNGVTWTTPVNATYTPNIEEKHSSVLRQALNTDQKRIIFYIRDMKAGPWGSVPGWGKAPVYGILKVINAPDGIVNLNQIAAKFELNQNYPNPFNPSTNIEFSIPKKDFVQLVIYSSSGQEVMQLVNEELAAGKYSADFNAAELASGVYYYKLIAGDYIESKKMVLVK